MTDLMMETKEPFGLLEDNKVIFEDSLAKLTEFRNVLDIDEKKPSNEEMAEVMNNLARSTDAMQDQFSKEEANSNIWVPLRQAMESYFSGAAVPEEVSERYKMIKPVLVVAEKYKELLENGKILSDGAIGFLGSDSKLREYYLELNPNPKLTYEESLKKLQFRVDNTKEIGKPKKELLSKLMTDLAKSADALQAAGQAEKENVWSRSFFEVIDKFFQEKSGPDDVSERHEVMKPVLDVMEKYKNEVEVLKGGVESLLDGKDNELMEHYFEKKREIQI